VETALSFMENFILRGSGDVQTMGVYERGLLGVRSFSSVLGLSLRFRVTGVNKGQEAAKAAYSKRSNKIQSPFKGASLIAFAEICR